MGSADGEDMARKILVQAGKESETKVPIYGAGVLEMQENTATTTTKKALTGLTAVEAAERIAGGEISAEEMTGACLDRIAQLEDGVHAFIHLDPDAALAQARALDERRHKGEPLGALHGVPVAIKDIFDTKDYPAEGGWALRKGRRPAQDAGSVARLRAAGAVIIGKSVTTECAYFHPGATRNPHDLERTPGGSSSGSAAAVAAQMVPLATGSQTNGSVIRPASFCGVYGFKPTHGTISRARTMVLSHALDHVGFFARSVADCALMLDVLAGYDAEDPDSRAFAAPGFRAIATQVPASAPSFAFVRTQVWDKADAEARAALERFVKNLGDTARPVDLPDWFAEAWPDHRVVMSTDMAHNLGPEAERGGEGSSQQLCDMLAEGSQTTAVRYLTARSNARRYAAGLTEILNDCDAIVTLPAPGIAPKGMATGNPVFNSLWTLTGLPAITLPLLKGEAGLPLGVQLIGKAGDDARLMRTANWLAGKAA
jgi:Asp-tRNA(Asn)/Glu-tRNA(Gln) amidotransferase A subunit family amidase